MGERRRQVGPPQGRSGGSTGAAPRTPAPVCMCLACSVHAEGPAAGAARRAWTCGGTPRRGHRPSREQQADSRAVAPRGRRLDGRELPSSGAARQR